MILGIDLDGVCADFVQESRVVCAEYKGVPVESLEPAKVWNFPEDQWGIPMDLFWELWFADVERGRSWWKSPVYPGTVDALLTLQGEGHKIVIITSRKGGELATASWVKEVGLPYDLLVIGRDKTIIDFDILIDDWERNWREVTAVGRRCVIFDRPWNAHLTEAERVHSWGEFIELVARAA